MDIEIRRVRPGDTEALAEFYARLSPDSRRSRFLQYGSGIAHTVTRAFCTLDHMHEEGFVALVGDDRSEQVVGHVCLVAAGAGRLELGICVAEGHQGHGIGRRLFMTAINWSRDRAFAGIDASCLSDNARVLALLSSAPYGAQASSADGGVVEVAIPLQGQLPKEEQLYPPVAVRYLRRHRWGRPTRVSRCRAASRQMPRPGRGAGGSASTGSS